VAKRQDARIAQQQVITHRKDAQDEHLDDHALPELGRAALGAQHQAIEKPHPLGRGRRIADRHAGHKREQHQQSQDEQIWPPFDQTGFDR